MEWIQLHDGRSEFWGGAGRGELSELKLKNFGRAFGAKAPPTLLKFSGQARKINIYIFLFKLLSNLFHSLLENRYFLLFTEQHSKFFILNVSYLCIVW